MRLWTRTGFDLVFFGLQHWLVVSNKLVVTGRCQKVAGAFACMLRVFSLLLIKTLSFFFIAYLDLGGKRLLFTA